MKLTSLAALGVLACTALTTAPASAQLTSAENLNPMDPAWLSTAATPTAEVRVFQTRQQTARSHISLINGTVVSICVASSTGRFRLRVSSATGGGLAARNSFDVLNYSIIFRDPTGFEQAVPMTSGEIIFEGQNAGAQTCSRGANATITVRSLDRDLSGVVAGEYFDRIVLSADPL